jgi:anthranilate phosphoribosyltransferase
MTFAETVQPLLAAQRLTLDQARQAMTFLMSGDASEAQIGAFLALVRLQDVTADELAGFAQAMRNVATPVQAKTSPLLDTCGTGGGRPSFNLSTGAAIVAAAAGVHVAKHGNRAITSKCGSADVLEALGVSLSPNPDQLASILDRVGVAFLFAQNHHPAMRHVGKARRELGFRTVFNVLGPLSNPARATRQAIGVFDPNLLQPVAGALPKLGIERGVVVHGQDNLDEVSPCAPTHVQGIWDGQPIDTIWNPQDFGIEPLPPSALDPAETITENANILKEALSNINSHRALALIPSAAVAIWLAGLEPNLRQAADRAKTTIASGQAIVKLQQLAEATQA